MKPFHIFALSVLLTVPFTAAQALDVQVDVCVQARQNNACAIKQDGTHNYARSAQAGEENRTKIEQRGANNDAGVVQNGPDNDVKLKQRSRR